MDNLKNDIIDINSIIYFLINQETKGIREIKYKDFIYHINKLSFKPENMSLKEKIDVAIFTANTKELDAFNRILAFRTADTVEYKNLNGLRIWKTTIDRKNKPPLTIAITMIEKAGNISCSLGVMRLLDYFDVKFSILSGIAAGLKNKYSVVFSEGVVDYEHQRLEPENIIYRPEPLLINTTISKSIPFFQERKLDVKSRLIEMVRNHPEYDSTEFDIEQLKNFNLEYGIIASGEKLLADDLTLQKLSKLILIKKGIIAGEMEGSGFSHACNEFSVPWLVIKGISDNGGDDKNEEINKKYQFVAALSSAIATIKYLQLDYRTKEDFDDF